MEEEMHQNDEAIRGLIESIEEKMQEKNEVIRVFRDGMLMMTGPHYHEDKGIRAFVDSMEEKMQQKDEAIRSLIESMKGKMQENNGAIRALRDGMLRLEGRLMVVKGRESRNESAGEQEVEGGLESRLARLEASLERALNSAFPRVEALLSQLEGRAPPEALLPRESSSIAASSSAAPCPSCAPINTKSPVALACREALGDELLDAAYEGKLRDVRRLLDAGVDANHAGALGIRPLMNAIARGHAGVAALLLHRGADVHANDDFGATALHYIAFNARCGWCESLLLEQGAEVNCMDDKMRTPLHWAVKWENEAAVRMLLMAGASKNICDSFGYVPLDWAEGSGSNNIRHMFYNLQEI